MTHEEFNDQFDPHRFESAGKGFENTCRKCGCFRASSNHSDDYDPLVELARVTDVICQEAREVDPIGAEHINDPVEAAKLMHDRFFQQKAQHTKHVSAFWHINTCPLENCARCDQALKIVGELPRTELEPSTSMSGFISDEAWSQ